MINKNMFRITNNQKLLRKVGKQWVVVSALTLMLLGGGALATSVVTHADTNSPVVEAQDTNSVKKQLNNGLDKAYQATQSASGSSVSSSKASQSNSVSAQSNKATKPSAVQSQANNMHDALLQNAAVKSSQNSFYKSTHKYSLTNTKFSTASRGSTSSKPSFNSAYQSYMAKMSDTDNKVANVNSNIKNNSNKNNKTKKILVGITDKGQVTPSDKHWIYNSDTKKYYGSDIANFTQTYSYGGLNYKYDPKLNAIEFTSGTAQSDLSDFSGYAPNVKYAYSIKFDNDINTSHVTNMSDMFKHFASDSDGDEQVKTIDFGDNFDTSNVTNMNFAFSSSDDENHDDIVYVNLGKKFNTNNVTEKESVFNYMASPKELTIGSPLINLNNIYTRPCYKIVHGSSEIDSLGDYITGPHSYSPGDTGTFSPYEHVPNTNVNYEYNGKSLESDRYSGSDSWNNNMSDYNNLDINKIPSYFKSLKRNYRLVNPNNSIPFDGKTHDVAIEPLPISDVIYYSDGGAPLNYHSISGQRGTSVTITPQNANQYGLPEYYHLVHKNNKFLIEGQAVYIDIAPDQATDNIDYVYKGNIIKHTKDTGNIPNAQGASDTSFNISNDIPSNYHLSQNAQTQFNYDGKTHQVLVFPNTETDMVDYIDNGKKTSFTISGNYNSDAKSTVDSHVPNSYHVVSGDTGTFTPNGTFNVQIAPNRATDGINYTYNHQTIGTSSVTGNTVGAQGASDTSINIKSSNAKNVPPYYHLANKNNQVLFDGKTKNIAIIPDQATDTISYTYNGHTLSSTTITGNNSNAKNASDTFDTITPNNLPAELPNSYQLVNTSNKIPYDGEPHAIAIEPIPSYFNVIEYTDSKGNPIGDTTAYGQNGTNIPNSIIENDIPKGYQVSQPLPVKFTDKNVVKVAVQSDNGKGDMVVGTAYLTLLYKKGSRTDGQVLRLHINGNIGDSDIVINPQDYNEPGYQVTTTKDWHIPFDYKDVMDTTHDFSRYNVENTFIYKAQPINIKVQYVDTQTNQPVSSSDDLGDIAYDGDTIDLQDANSSNGAISVDGNNYQLNLPTGYHLTHSNNYIKVVSNGSYVKKVSNGAGGYHSIRMPLMKLTLGITPHFRKPTSNSSVAPVKPSSASSVTPQPASSASVTPSSASVVPSSASQSVAPSPVTPSSMIAPSSTASVTPMTPSVAPSSIASSTAQPSSVAPASVSVKPSSISTNKAIARPVTRHVSHKHAKQRIRKSITKKHVIKEHAVKPIAHHTSHKKITKHDANRLNHQINQATHKLNIVEHHIEARKAIIRKAAHAERTIKHAKERLHYLRRNKRHVKHALRRITRNKVAIKHAKRTVRNIEQARPESAHTKTTYVEPAMDKSAVPSAKATVATPKAHTKSVVTTHTNREKLPQTSEAAGHTGIIAIVLMIMSAILAGFDKAFNRKHNE